MRLGFLGGKEFTIGGRMSNAYVKASALHDFGGNGGANWILWQKYGYVDSADLTGTWYEIGLGANLGIAKNSNLYFDALKTFNGDLRTDWQFNAGGVKIPMRAEFCGRLSFIAYYTSFLK